MKYIYTGTNMEVGDSVKKRAEKKLARLEKFLPNETEINIICTEIKFNVRVEVTAQLHKRILRAEVTESDINVCFDSVADILEKQIIKYKSRLRERWRRGAATNEEITFSENITEQAGAEEIIIHKTKKFALKPMDAHEAVMEMELLGHSFYVFRNDVTDEVNVVYKRNVDEYGLIEPH